MTQTPDKPRRGAVAWYGSVHRSTGFRVSVRFG